MARAAKLVKTGGRLVYATCSLLQDENEVIADAFLKANSDFVLVPAGPILQQQQINLDTGPYLKLLPHLHQTDGFFAAVFEKTAAKSVENIDVDNAPAMSVDEEVLNEKAVAKAKNIAKSAAKTKLASKPKSATKSTKKKA